MNRRTVAIVLAASLAACKGNHDKSEGPYVEPKAHEHNAREAEAGAAPPADYGPMSGSGSGGGYGSSAGSAAANEDMSGGTGTAMSLDEGKMGKKDSDRADGQYAMETQKEALDPDKNAPATKPVGHRGRGAGNVPEGPTRAWFPETFLFDPLVVTDDSGHATVPVRVPDRLTTWHVLALAHSRSGAQGGAVTSFLGTLPIYVDVVVPDALVRGDVVRLPIQIVNTSDAAISTELSIEAQNATVTGGNGQRNVPARGSVVEYARLVADHAGKVTLRVALGGGDAVLRTVEVLPVGRPVTTARSGTLAAPRTITIEGPPGSDPATDQVRLLAFPGALALLRSELGVCTARTTVADDAYALLLAGKATGLLAALGDQPDADALRDLAILAGQRAIRDARGLDVTRATLLTEAALAHTQNPVLQRLGDRAAGYLIDNQRPDGTFGGGDGTTLQQVLVTTAEATRAVAAAKAAGVDPQRASGVAIRASGAFERNADHIDDGYTAAAVLASGAVGGALVDRLRTKVKDAIRQSDDGARYLEVGPGVVRSDGYVPSRAEATALAALALAGDPQAPLADLGATLLGSYDPVSGWGDGQANLVCMQAVVALFKDRVPADVTISLTMDDQPIASGVLARDKLKDVLALDAPAPGAAGSHVWKVTATPAVPGLGYSLVLKSWVPWEKKTAEGLELDLPGTVTAAVGKPTPLAIRAIAPAGMAIHITASLPAGVQVDTPSLQALVDAQTIERFEVATGKVDLYAPALDPGETFAASFRVIPTLAGTLHASASTIEASGYTALVPPGVWTVQ